MKRHKSFDAYYRAQKLNIDGLDAPTIKRIKNFMMDAWTNARYGYIDTQPDNEQNAAIGHKIHELLNTLKDAMKIDCTCDKLRIKHGYPCICVRAGAMLQATKELGTYLRKLRKELK